MLFRIETLRDDLRRVGQNASRRSDPAQHRLVNDSQREHVEARVTSRLPPAHGRFRVGELIVERMDVDFTKIAQKTRVDQRTHISVAGQAVGAGHDHRGQARRFEGAVVHALGFAGVQGHSGLGQDVLARVKSRQRDRAMQVGPGPNHHRVDFGIG